MTDDAQLLREYVETGAEASFAELVQRHLALVYHAAARQLGPETPLAGDVAQHVFLVLAEKAPGLVQHTSLAGWLHATTRFKVAEALRAERRRRAREKAAHLSECGVSRRAACGGGRARLGRGGPKGARDSKPTAIRRVETRGGAQQFRRRPK